MVQNVSSYFNLGLHQLRCAPRLIIPFLISNALFSMILWGLIIVLILISLPIFGTIASVIEANHDTIVEIVRSDEIDDTTEKQIDELFNELSVSLQEYEYFIFIFLIILLILILLFSIFSAWTQGGMIGYLWQGITTTINFDNFIYYANRCFFRIIGLWILVCIATISAIAIPFLIFKVASFLNIFISAFLLVLLLPIFFILWVVCLILIVFSEQYIVIDDKSIIDSIKLSKELVIENKGPVLFFSFLMFIVIVVYFIIDSILGLIAMMCNSDFSTFSSIILLCIISPWIQLSIMNFFLDRTKRTIKVMEYEFEIIESVKEFVIGSPRILLDFIKKNIGYIIIALFFCGIGIAMGYYIGQMFSFFSDESSIFFSEILDKGRLIGPYNSMPLIDFINYFSINCLAGMDMGLGGLFLGIGAMAGAIFHGFTFGLVCGALTVESAVLLEIHGIIEYIALLICTAAGIRLGVRFLMGLGNINETIDETLKVVLASFLLFGIAALIEAFITPVIIWLWF